MGKRLANKYTKIYHHISTIYTSKKPHVPTAKSVSVIHKPASYAQKVSGSGQKSEKSSISRFAMCQSTKRA